MPVSQSIAVLYAVPSPEKRRGMSKGVDKKKEQKKKPAKTMKEKRAAKTEKKAVKKFAPE